MYKDSTAPDTIVTDKKIPKNPNLYILHRITNYAVKECDGKTCCNCWHGKKYKQFTLEESLKVLSNPSNYINIKLESFGTYKLYGDIDHCPLSIDQVSKLLSDYSNSIGLNDITISITQNNKYTKEGNSYHFVIPQYKCLVEDNKLFAEHLIEFAKNEYDDIGKWVDVGVYNCGIKGHFFRLPNQFKGSRFDIPCSENIHEIKTGTMEDFLLSYVPSDVKLFKPPDEWYTRKTKEKRHTTQQVPIINQCTSLSRKQVHYIKKLLKLLTIESMTEHDSWLKVMMFLRRYDLRELAHKYSKLCAEKYDENEIDLFFNKPNTSDVIGIGTIMHIIKKCNKEKYDKYIKKHGRLLIYKNTDEIFLNMDIHKPDIVENCERISDDTYNKVFNEHHKGVIIHACPGIGKTFNINKYSENNPDMSILSITSNRALTCNHEKQLDITTYLNGTICDKFVCSFEQLHIIKRNYDIIVIDEITSLLDKLYSPTVRNKVIEFSMLHNLCESAKKIIVCDATITDSVLLIMKELTKDANSAKDEFASSGTTVPRDNFIYYRNLFQSSKGKVMNIYIPKKYKPTEKVDYVCSFMEHIKDKIIAKKPCIVMSDSKKICDIIKKYVIETLKVDEEQIKLFTSDCGKLNDLVNCNEVFKNKLVIFSPKVLFGTDIQIEYESGCVMAIYTGGSVNGRQLFQQINRTRKSANVNILLLIKQKYKSHIVDYDEHVKNELDDLKLYLRGLKKLCPTVQMVADLVTIRKGLKTTINEEDTLTQIHLHNSWYDRIFNCDKSQLFVSLCQEQGYDIKYNNFDATESMTFDMTDINKESKLTLYEDNKKYIEGELNKNNDTYDAVVEKMDSRLKFLNVKKGLLRMSKEYLERNYGKERCDEVCALKEIAEDDEIFKKCMSSKILYDDHFKIFGNIMTKYDSEEINTWAIINKGAFNPNNILVLEEVERIAGVTKRFDIESVKYDENTKKSLEKISERLGKALYGKQNKKKLNERCLAKIETINDVDGLKGLLCDMYNRYDKIFSKKKKHIGKNGKQITTHEYTINDNTLSRHKIFLNALRDKIKIQCYDYDMNDALDNGVVK